MSEKASHLFVFLLQRERRFVGERAAAEPQHGQRRGGLNRQAGLGREQRARLVPGQLGEQARPVPALAGPGGP